MNILGDIYINEDETREYKLFSSNIEIFIITYKHIYKHMNKTVSHNIIQNCGELAWHINSEKYL